MRTRISLLLFIVCFAGFSAPVRADLRPIEDDTWYGALGGYWVYDSETDLSLSPSSAPLIAAQVNLTKDLDVEKSYAGPRLDAYWRFKPKHRVELSTYQVNRSGSRSIDRNIVIEGPGGNEIVFNAGAKVSTDFNIDVWRLSYVYSFYRSEQVELGVGAGIYGLDLSLKLSGDASINGVPVGLVSESAAALAPLPALSFRMDYSPADRWTVRMAIDQFFINQASYSGAFNDFRLLVEHQTFKHVAFGLGYDRLQLDLEVDNGTYLGKVKSFWTGVMAYGAVRF